MEGAKLRKTLFATIKLAVVSLILRGLAMFLKPRPHRSSFAANVLVVIACTALPLIAQQSGTKNPIVVELSAKKTVIHQGEVLKLHVTIKNQGSEPLYIPRDIGEINQRFVLSLRHGSKTEGSGVVAVGDSIFAPGQVPPFANLLSMQWIALDPGMFYGCDIDVDFTEFSQLRIPRTYAIMGRYKSHGFRENLRGFEEDTGKLPFKAWEGEVETTPVRIVVARAAAR